MFAPLSMRLEPRSTPLRGAPAGASQRSRYRFLTYTSDLRW